MNKPQYLTHAGMLLVALLYGSNYSAVKLLTPEYILPFGFLIYRVGLAGSLFWILGSFNQEKVDWKTDGKRILVCALFGVGVNMLFFFWGLSMTSAVHGSIIMTLTPIIVLVLSVFLLREKLLVNKMIGLVLGLLGALIIIFRATSGDAEAHWAGDMLILLNALSYGTYLVLAKPLLRKYKPITLVKWFFLFGFIFLLPFGFSEASMVEWNRFGAEHWMSFLFVIFGVTVFAYIINIWAMKRVNPSTIGAYIYLQPVFATLIALYFGESISAYTIGGAILVFVGVGLVVKKRG